MFRPPPRVSPARAAAWIAASLACVLSTPAIRALNVSLSRADVERALSLARRSEPERARFHAPYVIDVNDPFVEQVQVVTEFRRYVLITEDRIARGDWMFSQGVLKANEALGSFRGRVTIVARLRFNPLNAYVDLPSCEIVVLGAPSPEALDTRTTPITSEPFRVGKGREKATTLLGAVAETDFDAAAIGQTRRPILVLLGGRELKRLEIDFGRLE